MTKTQLKKLHEILARLETLQHMGVERQTDKDDLRTAKSALLRVLRNNDA